MLLHDIHYSFVSHIDHIIIITTVLSTGKFRLRVVKWLVVQGDPPCKWQNWNSESGVMIQILSSYWLLHYTLNHVAVLRDLI